MNIINDDACADKDYNASHHSNCPSQATLFWQCTVEYIVSILQSDTSEARQRSIILVWEAQIRFMKGWSVEAAVNI